MGKGIGFGKKVTERVELPDEVSMYSLKETTRRGSASKLARSIPPEYLEVADRCADFKQKAIKKIAIAMMAIGLIGAYVSIAAMNNRGGAMALDFVREAIWCAVISVGAHLRGRGEIVGR